MAGGMLAIRRWIAVSEPTSITYSRDGQLAAVGHERGLSIFDVEGNCRFSYPPPPYELPIVQARANPDFSQIYALSRMGDLIRLDIQADQAAQLKYQPRRLVKFEDTKVKSLAYHHAEEKLAVGFLSAALALITTEGKMIWHPHVLTRSATDRDHWSVALGSSGTRLFIGSGTPGPVANYLAAIEISDRPAIVRKNSFEPGCAVLGVAALPGRQGVSCMLLSDDEYSEDLFTLLAYDPSLSKMLWKREFGNQLVTAFAAAEEEPFLAVVSGGYDGRIDLFSTETGELLTNKNPLYLHEMISEISMASEGQVAAVTKNGQLVLIQYYP